MCWWFFGVGENECHLELDLQSLSPHLLRLLVMRLCVFYVYLPWCIHKISRILRLASPPLSFPLCLSVFRSVFLRTRSLLLCISRWTVSVSLSLCYVSRCACMFVSISLRSSPPGSFDVLMAPAGRWRNWKRPWTCLCSWCT